MAAERNLKLLIAYDGHPYYGWQRQPDQQTVQGEIERALQSITQEECKLANAGRTDTGVHALGQVANFRTTSKIPIERFRAAIQSQLPDSITIREVTEVPHEFHSGYDAKWKHYRYVVHNHPVRNPWLGHFATWISEPLDASLMNEAAQSIVGKQDFRSFESHFPNKATSVRTVMACQVSRMDSWSIWESPAALKSAERPLEFVVLDIVADGFLYNMVRSIMGTLMQVGHGRWPVSQVADVIAAQDRSLAGPTARPEGLYLMHVEYERDFDPSMISGIN